MTARDIIADWLRHDFLGHGKLARWAVLTDVQRAPWLVRADRLIAALAVHGIAMPREMEAPR